MVQSRATLTAMKMDFRDALIELGRRGLCNTIETRNQVADALDSLRIGARGVSIAPARLITVGNQQAAELLNCPASQGPYPPAGPTSEDFPGGQCDTLYRVTADVSFSLNGNPSNLPGFTVASYIGPIQGVYLDKGNGDSLYIYVIQGDGTEKGFLNQNANNSGYSNQSIGNVSVTRIDGLADDCGDGPTNRPVPAPLPYDQPDGTPVEDPVIVETLPPYMRPDGVTVWPVKITGPTYCIVTGFPSDGGEPTVGPVSGDPEASECCPAEGSDMDSPMNDEPDPPESDRRIVGVKVVATSVSQDANVTQVDGNGGPVLAFPRLGSIVFGVEHAGQRAWLNPIDIQNKNCYIECPDDAGAIDVKSVPVTGVALNVNPIYDDIVL